MIDVRQDIAHMLVEDAKTFNSCRKYIKVTLFVGEFGTAVPNEHEIKVRNYTQAQANLRRISNFFRDMHDLDARDNPKYPQAVEVTGCKVGAIVIAIGEMVGTNDIRDAIVYDIPITDGVINGYTRKMSTVMDPIY